MPRNKRLDIKQKLQTVMNELGRAENKLVETAQPFKEGYTKYYEQFCAIVTMVEMVRQAVQKLSDSV